MSILYSSGNSSVTLEHFINVENDIERLEIALRLVAECYDIRHNKTTNYVCTSFIAARCNQTIDWSDFVKDHVSGIINIDLNSIEVVVEKYANTFVNLFTKDFQYIGHGHITDFKWTMPPDYYYRFNGYHHYLNTEEELSRLVHPALYSNLTLTDIARIRQQRDEEPVPYYAA